MNTTKNMNEDVILVRFEFSRTQVYMLAFGPLYVRVIKNGAYITSGGSPIEFETPYTAGDLRDLYFAQSADVLYITHPNYHPRTLTRASDTSWTFAFFNNEDGPYLDVDERNYTMSLTNILNRGSLISTQPDFNVADVNKYVEFQYGNQTTIGQIKAFISAFEVTIEPFNERTIDVSGFDSRAVLEFAASGSGWSNRIRSNIAIWTREMEDSFIKVGNVWYLTTTHYIQPELVDYDPGGQVSNDVMAVGGLTVLATTGILSFKNHVISATLNCSDDIFIPPDTHNTRCFRLQFNNEQVWGKIITWTNAKTVSVQLGRMMPPDPNRPATFLMNATTRTWRLGAWYFGNFPACMTLHEERTVFAGTPTQPMRVWMSKSADYINFAPTDDESRVLDDSAITYEITSGQVNPIVWLQSSKVLLIGTTGGEWQTKASSITEPITPTNLVVIEQTPFGSNTYTRPQKVGTGVLFIQRSGNKVRELAYDFQEDSYLAKDLTIVSEHILRERGGGISSAYQKEPNSIYWVVTTDGKLVGLTYEKDQEVYAWHVHELGGNGQVISVATIPSTDGKSDLVYMAVRRDINFQLRTYIEYMEVEHAPADSTDKDEMFYVDSGLSYHGAPTGSVTGLTHLASTNVSVVADGTQRNDVVVTGLGVASVSGSPAEVIHVGLPYSSIATSMPLESGSESGTAQGKLKRIQRLIFRLHNSLAFKVGPTESSLLTVQMPHPSNLITGDVVHDFHGSYELQGSYSIVQNNALALNIIAVMPQMQTNI
jgi:hypothetical protein